MKFLGYRRPDGKVGIRNHVVVMPGVVCSSMAAQKIVNNTRGATYLYNPAGCGQCQADTARSLEILSGLLANPNVYGAVIVGLGCETLQEARYRQAIGEKAPWKRIEYISIQQEGGMARTVAKGVELAQQLLVEASRCRREECSLSELALALECGGSDTTSGLSANVVLGKVSDDLVDQGGTVVLSETSEVIGAEHILRARSVTPEIGEAIYRAVRDKDEAFRAIGEDIRDSNPSPGNIQGGLSTLEEKTLGCIHKCGTHPFTGFLHYGQQIDRKGTLFMDTAAMDTTSMNGKFAGGCQLMVFTTGRGNPAGSAIVPVIKVTGNHDTYEWMRDILDFDTSATLRSEKTVTQVADELMALILEVLNGRPTCAEFNAADVITIDQHHMGG